MIITPSFWAKKSIISHLLLPLSFIYFALSKIRSKFGKKFIIPNKFVICIGNITIGGSGKTPTTLALIKELQKQYKVCVLTKGYGRKTKGFYKVTTHHTTKQIGDEPYIMVKHSTVYLYSSINDLINNYHNITEDIIIMDDGMQNNVFKNFALMVIGRNGLGNNMIFPSGPLRETLKSGLQKTSAILYTSPVKINTNAEIPEYTTTHYSHCDASKNKPYIAFSGLGDNKKFELSLQNYGYNIIQFLAFKDHHSYTTTDLNKIHNIAMQLGCQIITTEKDFVKIPQELQKNIFVFYNEYALHQNLINEISTRIQEFL